MEDIIIEQRPETKNTATSKKVSKPVKKVKNKQGFISYLENLFNKTALISLLFMFDLLLFCRAGSVDVFSDKAWVLNPEIQYIGLGIIIVSFLVVFVSSIFQFLQNFVVAVIMAILAWVFMSQFALFDKESFLMPIGQKLFGVNVGNIFEVVSHWFVVLLVFLFSWAFFVWSRKRKQFKLVLLLFVGLFFLLLDLSQHVKEKNDFVELYADKVVTADKKGNNFVYIAIPNLPSYRYLERIGPKYPAAKNTLNAMLGLYTKNGFMLYTNAYNVGRDKFENLAQSLNMSTEGSLIDRKAKYNQSWNFKQISNERAELNKNTLLGTFEKNGYIRKIFEDRSIELCFMEGEQSANTCIRREMMPYIPEQMSERAQTMTLLGQWLGSMNLFAPSSTLYKFFKSFGVDDVPLLGVDYANIPALGGVETLDVVAKDIAENKGNRAYFVWLSLPDDAYVYDEFCQIKPIEKWVTKGGKTVDEEKRINAYFEQTSCLFGKLTDFMRKLKDAGLDENTVVVLQGVSGLDMISLKKIDKFEAERMVTMAIKDPKHNKFTINKQFCSAPKIVKQYLFKKEKCTEQEGLKFDPAFKKEIMERIENHNVINKTSIETLNEYGEWFRNWMRANYKDMVIPIEMPKVEQVPELVEQDVGEAIIKTNEESNAPVQVKEIKLHTEPVDELVEKAAAKIDELITQEKEMEVKIDAKTESKADDKVTVPLEPAIDTEKKIDDNLKQVIEKNANVVDEATIGKSIDDKSVENKDMEVSSAPVVASEVDILEKKEETSAEANIEETAKQDVITDEKIVGDNNQNAENELIEKQPDVLELLPGEEVVVLPQGENKADKIIIRINETDDEKQAKIEEEAREKAEKEAAEAKLKAEQEAEKAMAQAVEKVENALEKPSVDELGLEILPTSENAKDVISPEGEGDISIDTKQAD